MTEQLPKYSVIADQVFEIALEGECPSLTGRSQLTFQAARLKGTDSLHLRLAANSGKGMFCKDWAPINRIDAILARANSVTARTFNEVHPGKSINTGGFLLAVLKELGVVQAKEGNTRHHERVASTTVLDVVLARINHASRAESNKVGRKSKAE
jgi:hypothetical protein